MYQDWLPNEVKIQYRGPTWKIVHESFYKPLAKRANQLLGARQWYRARDRALEELHDIYFPGVTHRKLTMCRSARHSKFPECTTCQIRRKEYKEVAGKLTSIEEEITEKYDALVAHAKEWGNDRQVCHATAS